MSLIGQSFLAISVWYFLHKKGNIVLSNLKKKRQGGEGGLAWKHGLMSCFNYACRINSLDCDSNVKIG